ncbi:unnamed protein product (macronuclear) [Paramecium tetraurelia]|uniref:Ribosome biogenesis regulatory protein n=1 Tax=Paramecium tetraurelia TaxID=5888 RepID=A0EDK8_PARTE|nr:uncharacterized protein GSPATT00025718001 [Paramecium tetraurelia]CAK93375.1 unnamed protein product [Paramecium tetraurelia]|eukprot:XP_001460772.1 hypothetical protein (macronuclear) [Paramecium tetraurelia strain d4-2]
MTSNINILFDKPKLTLTALETVEQYDFDIIADKVSEQLKYVSQRLIEGQQETDLPYDKENIILPRQQTYIQKVKDSKFAKKKKNRMVWDENKKDWALRKLKKRDSIIPPIIEATKSDAYEDVFRKKEIEHELKKSKKQLRSVQKDKQKQKKLQSIKKQL